MNSTVTAVVVTYNTEVSRLDAVLSALSTQCTMIIVDNSTDPKSTVEIRKVGNHHGAEYLSMGANLGIAHAQNLGIEHALKNGAADVLLMDDDSIAPPGLVHGLLTARARSPIQPVVISARIVGEQGEDMSNRQVRSEKGLTSCSELTSSGTLVPATVFERVGLFDESLFIDCVDFEWGWRALAEGVPLMLSNIDSIRHRLGEGKRFGLRIPNPIRHYYQYRNVTRMIFRSEAPWRWRLQQFVKLPVKLLLIVLITDQPFSRLRYAAWGLYDALSNRTGQFNH